MGGGGSGGGGGSTLDEDAALAAAIAASEQGYDEAHTSEDARGAPSARSCHRSSP